MSTHEATLVQRLAGLAKLSLTDQEVLALTEDMMEMLRFADQIRAIDTRDVPMTHHIAPLQNVLRQDEPCPVMDCESVLKRALACREGYIAVPRAVEEGGAG